MDARTDDNRAIIELNARTFAPASWTTVKSRLQWWRDRCVARGIKPWPLTRQKIRLAAALLLKGGYRSARAYLSVVRRKHIESGYVWSAQLDLGMKDAGRAVDRYKGPDQQCATFDLKKVMVADVDEVARCLHRRWRGG